MLLVVRQDDRRRTSDVTIPASLRQTSPFGPSYVTPSNSFVRCRVSGAQALMNDLRHRLHPSTSGPEARLAHSQTDLVRTCPGRWGAAAGRCPALALAASSLGYQTCRWSHQGENLMSLALEASYLARLMPALPFEGVILRDRLDFAGCDRVPDLWLSPAVTRAL